MVEHILFELAPIVGVNSPEMNERRQVLPRLDRKSKRPAISIAFSKGGATVFLDSRFPPKLIVQQMLLMIKVLEVVPTDHPRQVGIFGMAPVLVRSIDTHLFPRSEAR